MTITHHPDEERLAAYAVGALDLGQHVAIATHLVACAKCRAFARNVERVGGALIADAEPAALSDGALDRVLKRLDETQPSPAAPAGTPTADVPGLLPKFVRAYTFQPWRRVAPKVAMRPIRLPAPSPTRVFLLKAAAGTQLLEHAHTGFEMTCVLTGGFHQAGSAFGPGDFDSGDGDIHHAPRIDDDGDCVSLIAMQGDLRWQGLIGRLLQPFIRL
jgi:putative transcriptional regulator